MNNRTLLLIFIGCLLFFFGAKFLRKDHGSSFDPVISSVDTSRVTRIKFISGGPEHEEFELIKSNDQWNAVKGKFNLPVTASNVTMVLQQLSKLEAKSVVTKDPAKYAEYEITDEMASKVIAWQGQREVADITIGGFRFDQNTRSASAFVRKNEGQEVYLVDGFVVMSLKQSFDQYRDKSLVKTDANDLTKLEWMNAMGRKEVIQKEDGHWHYAGMEALDTALINSYVQNLVNVKGIEFSDISSTDGLSLIEKMTLYGNNMIGPTVLSAYMNQDSLKPYLIHSTANPDAIFLSDSLGIYKRIFTDVRQFWPDGK